ncbi:MAG TPA: hypothetical protein VK586_19015 [Streptosporangiaceae bacterium]|nr:hypothetical protein [Streptosporangiaceae bacterium]
MPEEIFAAPPHDNGAGEEPASQPARPGPQPAFHRMWSSPTPPGEEDED